MNVPCINGDGVKISALMTQKALEKSQRHGPRSEQFL